MTRAPFFTIAGVLCIISAPRVADTRVRLSTYLAPGGSRVVAASPGGSTYVAVTRRGIVTWKISGS
jgi:hypothetical protein